MTYPRSAYDEARETHEVLDEAEKTYMPSGIRLGLA
jgi:hypothetical protein